MGLSCLIIALLWGTGSVVLIPLILCLCLTCIGYTPKGIRGGSPAACCMSCGEGDTPKCVSCGQSLGVKGLPCVALTFIFLVMTTIILLECPTITELYCDSLTTNSSLCYNSTGSSCFTFFGKGYCQVD